MDALYLVFTRSARKLNSALLTPSIYRAIAAAAPVLYGAWLYQPALSIGPTSAARKRSVIPALLLPAR